MNANPPPNLNQLRDTAVRCHQNGKLADAERLYRHILAIAPDDFAARHLLGVISFQRGQKTQALELIGAALKSRPHDAEALTNYGLVLQTLQRSGEALAHYDKAVAAKPGYALAWNNRGNLLLAMNRPQDALESYNRVLAIAPGHAGALYNRGNLLRDMKRFARARADYEKVLALDPADAEAWNNLGITLRALKQPEEALACHDKALAAAPGDAAIWYNRAGVLTDLSRPRDALADYDRALALDPGFVAALNNRGNILKGLKHFDQALACYDRALTVNPRSAETWINRGNGLQDLNRFDEALASFDQLLAFDPGNAEALFNRGTTLLHLHRFEEALASQLKALAADPNHAEALGGAANAALHLCDWRLCEKFAPELKRLAAESSTVPPFLLLGYSDDPGLQLQGARKYTAGRIKRPPPRLWTPKPRRHDRIKLAYISSDFRNHPVAHHLVGLLENHDRSRFDVLGISLGDDDGSPMRARIQAACDQFHDVRSLSDRAVAELLHGLEVDIAIDLNGHTQDARPGILAHCPAPVQVNYLGYPGTLGADFMDYVIGDAVALPFDQAAFFSEKIVQLPGCYLAGDPKQPISPPTSRREAGLPAEGFVFCCFNSPWKITAPVFDIWMRLLGTMPGSVLWLKHTGGGVRNNLNAAAAARGIDPARLIFAADARRDDYLARCRLADLFLDTAPYNAHATAWDALWVGLPLVTVRGKSFPGRVAASLLHAAGLGELVQPTLADYENLALGLARDPARLQTIRRRMAENSAALPLFDAQRYRRNMEAAYTKMAAIAQSGQGPYAFAMEDIPADIGTVAPESAESLTRHATALWQAGQRAEALAVFDRAVTDEPENAEAWNNRGAALQGLGRAQEALASYTRALAIRPGYADALYNRANVLGHLKGLAEALADHDRLLALRPDHAAAWCGRAGVLWDMKQVSEALASYDKAISLESGYAEALFKRGHLQWSENRNSAAAIRDMESALRADPDHPYARGDLLHLKMHVGDWRGFERDVALLHSGVRAGRPVAQPFVYLALSDSPADIHKCARIFADRQYPPAPALWRSRGHSHRKIRLGYVSGEFREQATAYLAVGLYESHDREKFELVAFDNGRNDKGSIRQRLEAAFGKFVPIAELSDREAAAKIQAEEIDILVNLNGYFGRERTGVFTHRPAPIQVSYLGFPATMGADYIDYILADPIVIPGEECQHYNEKVVRLPGTYQVNDYRSYPSPAPPARAAHGLAEKSFVFCNFNQSYKLTPATFALWMRILKQVDGSVLWLLENNPDFPGNMRREAERHGVDGGRLVFAPQLPMADHLAKLALGDLFLDSLPYNAHTTASDALWAGIPLVTACGNAFAGRVAASLLHAAGLAELVTQSLEEYEALAVRLAKDTAALAILRRKLAANRAAAPLFDTDRCRRHIEAAYARMWEIHCQGRAPHSFDVSPRESCRAAFGRRTVQPPHRD